MESHALSRQFNTIVIPLACAYILWLYLPLPCQGQYAPRVPFAGNRPQNMPAYIYRGRP